MKLALVCEFLLGVAWAASQVTTTAEAVALAGAVVMALGAFWRGLRTAAKFARRASHAYNVLLGIDERLEKYDERLEVVEGAMDVIRLREQGRITELLERGSGPGRRATDITGP